MKINWTVKPFSELNTLELYQILRLREEVFIIEQNCIYPDIDNKDLIAHHVIGTLNDQVIAYARIFKPGDYFVQASIGRVVNSPEFRNQGVGFSLVSKSIEQIALLYNQTNITISAQCYLIKFYESLGFITQGETYLEDNIPHIKMIRT